MRYFETGFLEQANEFLASLDKKSAAKVIYNIDLAEQTNDPRLFKKLEDEFGSSEQDMPANKSGCLPFGTNPQVNRHLLWQHMALSKRWTKYRQKKLSGQKTSGKYFENKSKG